MLLPVNFRFESYPFWQSGFIISGKKAPALSGAFYVLNRLL
jgi:hypothetical protein